MGCSGGAFKLVPRPRKWTSVPSCPRWFATVGMAPSFGQLSSLSLFQFVGQTLHPTVLGFDPRTIHSAAQIRYINHSPTSFSKVSWWILVSSSELRSSIPPKWKVGLGSQGVIHDEARQCWRRDNDSETIFSSPDPKAARPITSSATARTNRLLCFQVGFVALHLIANIHLANIDTVFSPAMNVWLRPGAKHLVRWSLNRDWTPKCNILSR